MSRAPLDRYLATAIHALFLILLFFLPLVMWTRASEVFEFPKMLFVYALTTLICAGWLARMVVRRQLLVRSTPLDIPILLFLLSQVISTVSSIEPHTSWFGYYSRFHGGLLSTISYTLLYYAFVSNENSFKKKFPVYGLPFTVYTIVASATMVSLYAILQRFGIDKDFWVQDVVNRVFSTQGQPNWLAAQLVMVTPLTWVLTLSYQKKQKPNNHWLLFTSYGLLIIATLALLFTKSRSGLLGLAAADIIFWLALLAKLKNENGKLKIKKQFVVIHLVIFLLALATNNPARDFLMEKLNPRAPQLPITLRPRAQGRETNHQLPSLESDVTLRQSEHGGTESGDIRRVVWKGALALIKQYPLTGTGPETFAYSYWWVRPVEHNLTSEWNFLYNKTHNEWLNLATNTGLFGLGSHLLLLVWFSLWILKGRSLRTQGSSLSLLEYSPITSAAILAALLGVEAVNFFGFSTVTIGLYRYLFMAFAVTNLANLSRYRISKLANRYSDRRSNLLISDYLLLAGIGLAGGYLLLNITNRFLADLSYNQGHQLLKARQLTVALEPLELAVELQPDEPLFRVQLAETETLLALMLDLQNEASLSAEFKEEALRHFVVALSQNPWQLNFWRTRARMTFNLGALDPELYQQGIKLAEQTLILAPTDPRGPYSLGAMYETLGDKAKANEYYQKALKLKPDYQEVKTRL